MPVIGIPRIYHLNHDCSGLRPASWAGPDRTASASRRSRGMPQPAHRPAPPLSPPSPATRMHRAVGCAGPGRRPGGRPDLDRVTAPRARSPAPSPRPTPPQAPGAPGPGDSDVSDGWQRQQNVSGKTALQPKTRLHRRCEGVPDEGRGSIWPRVGGSESMPKVNETHPLVCQHQTGQSEKLVARS